MEIDLHEGGMFVPNGNWRKTGKNRSGRVEWELPGTYYPGTPWEESKGENNDYLVVTVLEGEHPKYGNWFEYTIE